MSSRPFALRVHDLHKIYQVYAKPADRLKELLFRDKRHSDFHALEGVSFELEAGRCLGIVGDNGSGKSTLLQLIAGSLTPTRGTIERNGSVLGLLELGVGFHPEFTGRQNIFFYGDVLGVAPAAMRARFDEIVEFSELAPFIDRPIKTYSTGMVMRLAFSTITLLDPEILIIDEALSVGDAHFQKKCIDHILGIKQRGRTIVFCSHSTYQIGMICEDTIWMQNGRIRQFGETAHVTTAYEAYQLGRSGTGQEAGNGAEAPVRIASVEILNTLPISRGDDLTIRIVTECVSGDLPYHVMLSIKYGSDYGVYATGTHLSGQPALRGQKREIVVRFPAIQLMGGHYWLHARAFDDSGVLIYHERTLADPGLSVRKESQERGVCHFPNQWDIC
jgi:lipopolysaccharide transport system ATP-binding protein